MVKDGNGVGFDSGSEEEKRKIHRTTPLIVSSGYGSVSDSREKKQKSHQDTPPTSESRLNIISPAIANVLKVAFKEREEKNIALYYAEPLTEYHPSYNEVRHEDFGGKTDQHMDKIIVQNIDLARTKLTKLTDQELYSAGTLAMVHKTIFQGTHGQIAGHTRSEREAMHRAATSFKTEDIAGNLQRIMNHMQENLQAGDSKYTQKFAVYYMTAYLVHPFIDGNTRSTDVYMQEVARRHGHTLKTNYEEYTPQLSVWHYSLSLDSHKNIITLVTGNQKNLENYKMSDILDKMEAPQTWPAFEAATAEFARFLKDEGVLRTTGEKVWIESIQGFSERHKERLAGNIGLETPNHEKEADLKSPSTAEGLDLKMTFTRRYEQEKSNNRPKER